MNRQEPLPPASQKLFEVTSFFPCLQKLEVALQKILQELTKILFTAQEHRKTKKYIPNSKYSFVA